MKKSKFKYKEGQSVNFKYYDGSVHNGIINKRLYRNEDSDILDTQWTMPTYTIRVPDNSGIYSRGYMVYPCITQNMIRDKLTTNVKIIPLQNHVEDESSQLRDAIQKQKDFVGGKVKN